MEEFNSSEYSWCDVTIVMGGRIIEGVTGISYTEKKDKAYLFGRGCKPHKIVHGARTADGKIKIWQSELEAMIRDAKNNDILNLEFNITITYIPRDGGQTVVDILKGCQFTEVSKEFNQGDKNMIVELPIMFLEIAKQQ